MSDRIATLHGVALSPGVSKNNRRYTAQAVQRAHDRLKARLADPAGRPVVMRTFHPASESDLAVTNIAGRVTAVSMRENGDLLFDADVPDTAAGRDVAALVTAAKPYLANVSIRGLLVGESQVGRDGIEVIDDIEIDGLDLVTNPGVSAARILAASVAESSPGHVVITESVEETTVILEGGDAPGDGKKPYGNVTYADPGYQKDGKKRYPLDTAKRVRAANAYINVASNAAKYTSAQVKRIKSKIATAAKKFDIDLTAESIQLATEVLEAYAAMTLDNNAAVVDVRGYISDPSDLAAVGAKLSAAAMAALATLDPDNDGDIDLPDGDATPDCAACGCSCDPGDNFCPVCGAALPPTETDDNAMEGAPATPTEGSPTSDSSTRLENNMPEETTTKPEGFAGMTVGVPSPHGGTPEVKTEAAPAAPAAPATPAAPAATTETAPAGAPTPAVSESDMETFKRVASTLGLPLSTAPESAPAASPAAPTEGAPETAPQSVIEGLVAIEARLEQKYEQKMADAEARLTAEAVALIRSGGRKGVVRPVDESGAVKPLHEMSEEERNAYASEAWASVLGR